MKEKEIINNKTEKEINVELATLIGKIFFNLKEYDISGIKLYSNGDLNSFDVYSILNRNVFQFNADGDFIPVVGTYKIETTGYELDIEYGRVVRTRVYKNK